jgi:hypothetical protein
MNKAQSSNFCAKILPRNEKNRACFGDHRVKGHDKKMEKMIQTYRCKEEVNPKYIINFICYVSTEIKKNKSTEYRETQTQ